MPEHAPDYRHIGTGTHAHKLVGMRSGARETRIDDDQRCIVAFRGTEHVLHGYRVCLGWVATDDQDRLAVMNIIVGVGHGTVAPGIGDAGDRGGMTDTCLVVHVIGTPHGGKLAEQIGLFVVVLGRSQPVDRIGTGLLADGQHLVPDLVDGLVPGDFGPLAIHQLGRILSAGVRHGHARVPRRPWHNVHP